MVRMMIKMISKMIRMMIKMTRRMITMIRRMIKMIWNIFFIFLYIRMYKFKLLRNNSNGSVVGASRVF